MAGKENRMSTPKTFVPLKAWVVVDRNGYTFTGGLTLSEAGIAPLVRRAVNQAEHKDLPFTVQAVTIEPRGKK
jgi:hypothetical protein